MKVLGMSEEQRELQRECELIHKQLSTINKTIGVLKGIKGMKEREREKCKEDINVLMNWIYN